MLCIVHVIAFIQKTRALTEWRWKLISNFKEPVTFSSSLLKTLILINPCSKMYSMWVIQDNFITKNTAVTRQTLKLIGFIVMYVDGSCLGFNSNCCCAYVSFLSKHNAVCVTFMQIHCIPIKRELYSRQGWQASLICNSLGKDILESSRDTSTRLSALHSKCVFDIYLVLSRVDAWYNKYGGYY